MRGLAACLGRLARDRRGLAATEYALLLPVLLLLTVGLAEGGLMLMTDATLEMAVQAASRYAITNVGAANREENIRAIVDGIAGRWADTGTLTVEAIPYASLSGIDGSSASGASFDPGSADAVVLYRVTLTRSGFSGVLRLAGMPSLTFRRWLAVQNEPAEG